MTQVQRYTSAGAFYQDVMPILAQAEAINNLSIGVAGNLAKQLAIDPSVYLARVLDDAGETCMIALRTPPLKLLIAHVPRPQSPDAVAALVADIDAFYGDDLSAVLGTQQDIEGFRDAWAQHTGTTPRKGMPQRIYQLEAVTPPQGVAGAMRDATLSDYDFILAWVIAFHDETYGKGNYNPDTVKKNLSQRLYQGIGGYGLWEVNGQPVALAGFGGQTPNGMRIGPVYTPPSARRKGYGSAVTAALSQKLLDSGRQFCFLYTDLSNPTSNHIYQTIGYAPVCDVDEYWFDA